MPKNLMLSVALFVLFIAMALLVNRCDMKEDSKTGTFWNKLTRRLFDEDMPSEDAKAKRRFDMTSIGSTDQKTDR